MSRGHKGAKVDGVDIDEGLAELIRLTWALGLETLQCCQEGRPGEAYIVFGDVGDVMEFLFVAQCGHPELESWDEAEEGEPRSIAINLLAYFPVSLIPDMEARLRAAVEQREAERRKAKPKKARPKKQP